MIGLWWRAGRVVAYQGHAIDARKARPYGRAPWWYVRLVSRYRANLSAPRAVVVPVAMVGLDEISDIGTPRFHRILNLVGAGLAPLCVCGAWSS